MRSEIAGTADCPRPERRHVLQDAVRHELCRIPVEPVQRHGACVRGLQEAAVHQHDEAAVGADNLFLFGLGPLETHAWREGRVYRPRDVYSIDPLVRLSLDALVSSRYAPSAGAFDWAKQALFDPRDPWLVLADLGAYVHRQDEALAEFADPRTFTEKAILTLARSRRFWVERPA